MTATSAAAFARAGALGPFFDLAVAEGIPLEAAGEVVAAEIDRVRAAMAARAGVADVDARIAASSVQLSGASRIIAPALAMVGADGLLPDLSPSRVYVTADAELAVDDYATTVLDPDDAPALGAAFERWVLPSVSAWTALVERAHPIGESVATSNAASAAFNACNAVAFSDASLAGPCRRAAAAVLAQTWLAAGASTGPDGRFRRRGCCLFYRVPGAGLCGDCVIEPA